MQIFPRLPSSARLWSGALSCLSLFLLTPTLSSAQDSELYKKEIRTLFREGKSLAEKGQYKPAILKFVAALSLFRSFEESRLSSKDKEALQRSKTSFFYFLGRTYQLDKQETPAFEYYLRCVEHSPRHPLAPSCLQGLDTLRSSVPPAIQKDLEAKIRRPSTSQPSARPHDRPPLRREEPSLRREEPRVPEPPKRTRVRPSSTPSEGPFKPLRRFEITLAGGGGTGGSVFLQFSWRFSSIFALVLAGGGQYGIADLEEAFLVRSIFRGFVAGGIQMSLGSPWSFLLRVAPGLGYGGGGIGFSLLTAAGLLYRFESGFLFGVTADLHWALSPHSSFLGLGGHLHLGYSF